MQQLTPGEKSMDIRGLRTIMSSLLALAATAAGLLGSVHSAQADLIKFNPTGSGLASETYTVGGLQFGAGNAVAVGAVPLTVGKTFDVYFQTNLTGVTGGVPTIPGSVPAPLVLPGLNTSYQITEVAKLTEMVTAITTTPGVGTTATFSLVPSATNQIAIYFNNAVTFNSAAGTGYTSGIKIATLNPSNFTGSDFQDTTTTAGGPNAPQQFNTTGQGKQSGTGFSDVGSGHTGINNTIPAGGYNASFFQPTGGTPTLVASVFQSNLAAPFGSQQSPSLQFVDPFGGTINPNIGAVNGNSGPDIQLLVSGITNEFAVQVVPEPASMTLMGLGVVGALVLVRRTRARAA